ncbi:MAG: GDSL-type esterase/lipase family protein [Thermoanaerobaculia bacterium]
MPPWIRIAVLTAVLAVSVMASPAPEPRRIHVAVVGDSLAHGAGDEEEKGIAGRLEAELKALGIDSVVTTKLGSTGATTRDFAFVLRQPKTRSELASADAFVLSIGANDLREAFLGGGALRSPIDVVDQVLRDIAGTVTELHRINPRARVLLLGGYTPIPEERVAIFLEPIIALWDAALMVQFVDDPLVSVVRLSDILDRPERLSTLDSFHPGSEAYQEAARRIAGLLAADSPTVDANAADAAGLQKPPVVNLDRKRGASLE